MAQTSELSILRRKTGAMAPVGSVVPEGAITPERVLRQALEKAADQTIGLAINVTGVTVAVVGLDDLIGPLDPADMLVGVDGRDGPAGLIAADAQTVMAVVERQTMGRLATAVPSARGLTGTDLALTQSVLAAFLNSLPAAAAGSDLAGWADSYAIAARVPTPRAAGMMLADGSFRVARLSLDFMVAGRVGTLMLALPLQRPIRAAAVADSGPGPWAQQMRQAVMAAPAELVAVLHRLRLPLRAIEGFSVGQVIALDGTTVGSVRLEGPDGAALAHARLGQAAGLRAVRIEGAAALQMRETLLEGRTARPGVAAVAQQATDGVSRAQALID